MRKLLLILSLTATPVLSQDSDKDYLTAFLEDSLSDAGREVTVTGFVGALSSQATIETLSIADADGVWLQLKGVKLDWSQSALLSGELVVNELSAESLTMTRLPGGDDSVLPTPEARGFSLPELPVAIGIGKLAIDRIALDAAVLGQPVEGRLDAALTLAQGAGLARLELLRSADGPSGSITLFAGYDNATRQLDLKLLATEGAGGIVASALGLPGEPAASFSVAGSGPLDAFAADIRLATDGQERLVGNVTLAGEADGGMRLDANLSGNLAPLFLPDYAEFLGDGLDLTLKARRAASGSLSIDSFALKARALSMEGTARIASDGLPESLSLTGRVADPEGRPVLLPLSGPPTRIADARFSIETQDENGLAWTTEIAISGLDRPAVSISELDLSGAGHILRDASGNHLTGSLAFSAAGVAPVDPGLASALGDSMSGSLALDLPSGGDGVQISDLVLTGAGLQGGGELQIEGLSNALLISGNLALQADDLSRFATLSGLPLEGSGRLSLDGSFSLLSGGIDGLARLTATGLQLGIVPVDRMLQNESTASLSILRDETGTTVRSLELVARDLNFAVSGRISSADSDLTGSLSIADLSILDPAYAGSASLDLGVTGATDAFLVDLTGTADGLAVGNAPADRLLAGTSKLTAALAFEGGQMGIQSLKILNDQLELLLSGTISGDQHRLSLAGKLSDLGLLVPDLGGALTLSGTVLRDKTGYAIDLVGRGPGQVDARIVGSLLPDLSKAELVFSGTGQAGLANPFIAPRLLDGPTRFDLRLSGPLALTSVSGDLTLSKGRLSDPDFGFSFGEIEAVAALKAGRAQVSATAELSTGGTLRLDGPVGLAAPHSGDLTVSLDQVRFFDPRLYETILSGRLGIKGALAGGATISGALSLSETELRVPESGLDAAGILATIDHRNEPAEVRATRVRAGLLGGKGSGSGPSSRPYRLDLALSAPSRIFLRGRGIDAELGGALRLAGTTDSVVPAGEFSLIRGRLDILGKRLVLDTANLILEGSFVPHLEIAASTESDGIQSTVMIDGPADDPTVTFASVPDLPQEEVLARLLFGRGLDTISALQAAQLAQAVAVLAGRGGEGVIARLRKGFGLDDLDVATADDGSTAVKAGKYLTESLYSEIEVDQSGTSTINLNLDLRPGVTVKGQLGADGDSGIGIFVEQDY